MIKEIIKLVRRKGKRNKARNKRKVMLQLVGRQTAHLIEETDWAVEVREAPDESGKSTIPPSSSSSSLSSNSAVRWEELSDVADRCRRLK